MMSPLVKFVSGWLLSWKTISDYQISTGLLDSYLRITGRLDYFWQEKTNIKLKVGIYIIIIIIIIRVKYYFYSYSLIKACFSSLNFKIFFFLNP